jgi:hypothetical protein
VIRQGALGKDMAIMLKSIAEAGFPIGVPCRGRGLSHPSKVKLREKKTA